MKNSTAIMLLFLANTISGIAQGISMISIPWYFSQLEDMTRFGMVYALATLVALFWVPFSGMLVDKYNRKHIFLAITSVCGALVLGIAVWGQMQDILPWWAVAAVFMITFFNYNIHYPNLYAFAQEITEPSQYGRITSILEIIGQMTSVLAGAGAAMLLEGTQSGSINLFGAEVAVAFQLEPWLIQDVFLLDGITYVFAFLIIALIRYTPISERVPESGSVWKRLQTGWNWLTNHRAIFLFGLFSYVLFATILIEGFYLGANYVQLFLEGGAGVYAASEMYFALGSLLAGISIRRVFAKIGSPRSILILTALSAILYVGLTFFKSIPLFYVSLFLIGLSNAGTRIQRVTYLFKLIPNQVYGRASGIFFLFNALVRILMVGIFALPLFQNGDTIQYTFGIMAI
ncbi:MAG: MFS transporter, partial [Bacteroidota bacterium]